MYDKKYIKRLKEKERKKSMKKMINNERIEGLVYEHTLEIKTVANQASANYGKEFIAGEVRVAVDDELLNVIPVHFTYVTETTSSGRTNSTYSTLKRIIEEKRTVVEVGADDAFKVRIDTALALNDFYTQDNQLVSTKTNEGGFVTIINELGEADERNKFTCDMVITNVNRIEADPERNIEKDYVIIKGVTFNFRNAILPVEFKVENPQGMEWFESLDASASNPTFTKVWGKINCNTIVRKVTEESAFGEAAVRTYERKVKDWVVIGCQAEAYDFGAEEVLTAEELSNAIKDREVMLADTKKRSEEYRAQRNSGSASSVATSAGPVPTSTAKQGTFNF
jgi:hypothetical protein